VEGEGGTGGVVVCFWVTLLPGEKGAGSTAGEVWSVSMTTRGDPDELGALPWLCACADGVLPLLPPHMAGAAVEVS
jgi:hypothetical protein